MSPEELRALADKKEQESTVVKIGYLKHDLYSCYRDKYIHIRDQFYRGFYNIEKHIIDDLIKNVSTAFKITAKQGTKFVCYIVEEKESWFDDENIGIEDMPKEWAEEHLENITVSQE